MELYCKYEENKPLPQTPQECDYYFETREDFKNRIEQICIENNYDLINKTFGFGDNCNFSDVFIDIMTGLPVFPKNPQANIDYITFPKDIISTPKAMIYTPKDATYQQSVMSYKIFSDSKVKNISKYLFSNCNLKAFIYTFSNCNQLEKVPEELFKKNIDTDVAHGTFQDCGKLNYVPSNLFDGLTNLSIIKWCFKNCSEITSSLPDVWNKEKFPRINYNTEHYAYGCTKAANYADIPDRFK